MSETPILDLEHEPPEPPKPWLPKIIGFMAGLLIALVLIMKDRNELHSWNWPAFNGLLLIPALYAAIAIHEIGHLLAGTLVGFETGGIAIGGFLFVKSGKNWTFRFDRRLCIMGFFKPLTTIGASCPARFAWMIAGGPLASLALTLVCFLTWVRLGDVTWDAIGSVFWVSLFTTIISAIPFSSGLNRSDGARLWLLLRHPERARSWMALLALQTEEAKGVRPHEWDSDLFEQALSINSAAGEYPYCQLLAFYRRLDERAESAALRHLENALAGSARSGKLFRHALFKEAASASANLRKRPAQARAWCQRACKLRKPESLDAVEAGIAMCEKRYEEALRHWEAARAFVLRRKLDSGLVRFAKEKWAEYESACRAAASGNPGGGYVLENRFPESVTSASVN